MDKFFLQEELDNGKSFVKIAKEANRVYSNVQYWAKKYKLKSKYCDSQKPSKLASELTREEKRFLMGLAFGDGYIYCKNKVRKTAQLNIVHGAGQIDYIRYKAERLSKIFGKEIKINSYMRNGFASLQFSAMHRYFKIIHKWLYPNNKKTVSLPFLRKMSDEAVAIWYMDDGSFIPNVRKNGRITSGELVISMYVTEFEANQAIIFFSERYGANFTLKRNKGKFSIRCSTQSALKVFRKIHPYIIPSMRYKCNIEGI